MDLLGLHHVRFRSADLSATEKFAQDFGLITVERTDQRLVMRTAGGDAYCYIAEAADRPGFAGFALEAASVADLEEAVSKHGATPVRDLDMSGGGKAVTLTDPNGFKIDMVTGVARSAPLLRAVDMKTNTPDARTRFGATQLLRKPGPPYLYRLGHLLMFVPDYAAAAAWYEKHLGIIGSDVYHIPQNPNVRIVGFFRLNRGELFVDHHTIAFVQADKADLHHISFEAQDFETQFVHHRYLQTRGYESVWGVGRHPHGSHIFDVWRDPNGYRFETFTDTDLLQASRPTDYHDVSTVEMDIWSPEPPDRYFA